MNAITLTLGLVTLVGTATITAIDLSYLDTSVDPCTNFYQFACGNFPKHHPRPQDEDYMDLFKLTENELLVTGQDILSAPKRRDDPVALKKAKAAYAACVNDHPNYTYYDAPERQILEEFGGLPLIDDTAEEKLTWTQIGQLAGRFGIHQMFEFMVTNFNPDWYILLMMWDSWEEPEMIRPESAKTYDQLLEESFKRAARRPNSRLLSEDDPFDVFLRKISTHLLCSRDNCTDRAAQISDGLAKVKEFMRLLMAKGIADDNMVPPKAVLTLKELQEWSDEQFGGEVDINWVDYLDAIFKPAGVNITDDFEIYLTDPKSVYSILNLVRQTDAKTVKNFVLLRTFLLMAPDSDSVVREAFEEYFDAMGLKYYERSEYCTRKILDVVDTASLSFAVAHEYVNYHFNINKIPKIVQMFGNLKEVFKTNVRNADWVDAESRELIIQKVDNIVLHLGYPDFVEDKTRLDTFYENVRICEWDNYGNAQRIRAFKKAYAFSEYRTHENWGYSPFKVNAFAIYQNGGIMMPLAMLQSGYFQGGDPLFDYSRLGSTIAHEMLHHFDSHGIGYNQTMYQTSWVSNSTLHSFEEKTQCLVDQYFSYYFPEVGLYLNGSQTLDENLADNGGLRQAFKAFRTLVQQGQVDSQSTQYSRDQLFFISYATAWCSQESEAYLENLITNNAHPPARVRVLGTLSNMEEFSEAFRCPIGSAMNPKEKCAVW